MDENERNDKFTKDQIICSALIGLLIIIGFYITTALFVYGKRMTDQLRARTRRAPTSDESRLTCLLNNAQILLSVSSLLALCRFIMEMVEVRYGMYRGEVLCTVLNSANIILMTISLSFVYLVLWLRQRKFNNNLPMKGLWLNVIQFISWLVLFLLITSCLGCLVLFLGLRKYRGTPKGCDFDWNLPGSQKFLRVAVIFGFTLFFQILLLFLLGFPLLKHRKSLERMSSSQRSHLKVMQRLTICAVVAIAWNGAVGAVIVFHLNSTYSMYNKILYDVDFLVLLLCTIVSFRDWRERLAPWCIGGLNQSLNISQLIL